jgi:hypothetical protein
MAQLPMLGDNGYVVSPNLQATFVDPHLLRPARASGTRALPKSNQVNSRCSVLI